jgi:predicted amidophosphoribosyltransferase
MCELILGIVIVGIILLIVSSRQTHCPYCRSVISKKATFCPHCQRRVNVPDPGDPPQSFR